MYVCMYVCMLDLVLSQHAASQTPRSVREISRSSSVVSWSHHPSSLHSHPPIGKQRAIRLLVYSRVV